MAAVVTQTTSPVGAQVGPLLFAKSVVTAIPATGDTDVLEIPTLGLKNIGIQVNPTTNDLDAFKVYARFHPEGAWVLLYSAIDATPTESPLVIAASGTLAALAAGATGWFTMDVRGIYAIKIAVSGTVADTTGLTVLASGSR